MAGFELYYTYNESDYLLPFEEIEDLNWRNVQGFPGVSVTLLSEDEEGFVIPIPGVYKITFDATSVAAYQAALAACDASYTPHSDEWTTCREAARTNSPVEVIVSCDHEGDASNPNINESGIEIDNLEGNENINVIPGLNIEFTQSPYDFQRLDIAVGVLWDDAESRYVRILPFGIVPCGSNSSTVRLKGKNVSGSTMTNVEVYVLNKCTIEQIIPGRPLYTVTQINELDPVAFEDTTPLEISFANYTAGSPATVQILINGTEHDVIDHTTGYIIDDAKELKCDDSTMYSFGEGTAYAGLAFRLSSSLQVTDTATIVVSPGSSIWRIKKTTDSEFNDGNDGILIGDIENNETFEFDIKANPYLGSPTDVNIIEGLLRINGTDLTYGESSGISVGLTANLVEGDPTPMLFRCSVMPGDVISKLAEFGVEVS